MVVVVFCFFVCLDARGSRWWSCLWFVVCAHVPLQVTIKTNLLAELKHQAPN